jgi:hypothetical protein
MQEQKGVEAFKAEMEESISRTPVVSEPAAMVTPTDNPVARTEEPQPAIEPEPVIEEPEVADTEGEAPEDEEFSRLKQTATQLAHDAARVLLDAADGEGGFRGGDIRRRELIKLRSSVMEYLREHERRTKRRIFEDMEDRQVLGLD